MLPHGFKRRGTGELQNRFDGWVRVRCPRCPLGGLFVRRRRSRATREIQRGVHGPCGLCRRVHVPPRSLHVRMRWRRAVQGVRQQGEMRRCQLLRHRVRSQPRLSQRPGLLDDGVRFPHLRGGQLIPRPGNGLAPSEPKSRFVASIEFATRTTRVPHWRSASPRHTAERKHDVPTADTEKISIIARS